MTSTARSRRFRERRAAGRISVLVDIDEVATIEVLCAANLLDRQRDHSRADIGHALGQLIELLASDL
jgi:hypothetical protein